MIKKYIPSDCYKTIFDIDFDKLYNEGIRGLLFDIDNTILPYGLKIPQQKHIEFMKCLKDKGFKICLISNNNNKRVNLVADKLDVLGVSKAMKPHKKGYLKASELLKIDIDKLTMIGDQMLTDIAGANKLGIKTILVQTIIIKKQKWYTKINRLREKGILRKLKKEDKGMYEKLRKEVYFDEV